MNKKNKSEIICLCNNISAETIRTAIVNGAKTANDIFDTTTAGVGPCGGSCRRRIIPYLEEYLKTGIFPNVFPPGERTK